MNISFIKKREKILFIIVGALAIIGVTGYYIYFYAPLGEIKNLNRAVIRQCNRLLNDKNEVLCVFNENTKQLYELPIKVNDLGYALNAPLNQENRLKHIEIQAQILPTKYPEMKEIKFYQQYLINEIKPNNVLILSINLPKIFKNTLHSVASEEYEIINKPTVSTSLCFSLEPINYEKETIGGEYLIYPSSLIFSKSTENSNVFCTKALELEKYPILTYINKLPQASPGRNDYFGIKIFLPPPNKYQKSLTTNDDFEADVESFLPFYRYRIPFITNIISQ